MTSYSSLNLEFHELLKKMIGDSDGGLLRMFQQELGSGTWKSEVEGKFIVGQCDAIRRVLDIAEDIRLQFMER